MPMRKSKQDERDSEKVPRRQRIQIPSVTIRVHEMDEQQARRLSTAVDALLTEWVRVEMGRLKQP